MSLRIIVRTVFVTTVVQLCFQTRDKLGLIRNWPHDGTYQQLAQTDLLRSVQQILKAYQRWQL